MKTESYFITITLLLLITIMHVQYLIFSHKLFMYVHMVFHTNIAICSMYVECVIFVFMESLTLFPLGHIRGCTNMTRCEYLCLPNPNVPSKQTCTCTTGIEPLPDGACPESMFIYTYYIVRMYVHYAYIKALSRTQSALYCPVCE